MAFATKIPIVPPKPFLTNVHGDVEQCMQSNKIIMRVEREKNKLYFGYSYRFFVVEENTISLPKTGNK